MTTVNIKVDTAVFKEKANQVLSEVVNIERQWLSLQDTIKDSKGYWQGEASNRNQKYLSIMSGDMDKIIRRIKEHPIDLMKMAGVYDASETKATQLGNKLPEDVIV